TLTFTNIASGAVAAVISVSLNVSAGPPTVNYIFPSSVTAAPALGRVKPVITIYGGNQRESERLGRASHRQLHLPQQRDGSSCLGPRETGDHHLRREFFH